MIGFGKSNTHVLNLVVQKLYGKQALLYHIYYKLLEKQFVSLTVVLMFLCISGVGNLWPT